MSTLHFPSKKQSNIFPFVCIAIGLIGIILFALYSKSDEERIKEIEKEIISLSKQSNSSWSAKTRKYSEAKLERLMKEYEELKRKINNK